MRVCARCPQPRIAQGVDVLCLRAAIQLRKVSSPDMWKCPEVVTAAFSTTNLGTDRLVSEQVVCTQNAFSVERPTREVRYA